MTEQLAVYEYPVRFFLYILLLILFYCVADRLFTQFFDISYFASYILSYNIFPKILIVIFLTEVDTHLAFFY